MAVYLHRNVMKKNLLRNDTKLIATISISALRQNNELK